MDIVFRPDGNFDEVYLYEELMEADLHAIVRCFYPSVVGHALTRTLSRPADPLAAAAVRRSLPVFHLPDALWPQVHPLG